MMGVPPPPLRLLLLLSWLLASAATADARAARQEINVLDFGAVGDGDHDDTTSIQAAIHAAAERAVTFSCNLHEHGITEGPDTGVCGMSRAEVFLPAGNYTITRALVPGIMNVRNISGENRTNHTDAYDGCEIATEL